jgi:hypothetical protein
MKRIKVDLDKKGNFTMEPLEGFSGTVCEHEIQNLVTTVGATVTETKEKPEYYAPENPEDIFVNNND